MKLRHFFFAAMLIGGFAACSDEENLGGVDNGSSKVNAYMTLQIVGPQGMGTKTQGGPTQVGTAGENKISSVTVLLCNQTSKAVEHIYRITSGLEDINGGAGVRTPIFPTTTGTYDVYVIANEPSGFISQTDVITSKTINDISEKAMQDTYAKDNTFMMFNACHGTNQVAGATINITQSNDYDNPASCSTIQLDRLAVKITPSAAETVNIDKINGGISGSSDAEFASIQNVTLKGFKLLNGAIQANLQQKWSNATTDQGAQAPWLSILQTPDLAEGNSNGTPAGYYNHLSYYRLISYTSGDAGSSTEVDGDITYYNYTAAQDMYDNIPYYNASFNESQAISATNNPGPIYCMENNSTDDLNGNTTGLIFKWQVTLNENASDNIAGTNCFYAYDGKFYGKLSDLISVNQGIVAKVPGTDINAKIDVVENELQTAYATNTDTEKDAKQKAISDFRAKYKIKVYTEGIMYYTYFIKDQNYRDTSGDTDSHYYSVMRNTIYDLKVTALNGIGTDIPGGWNPDVDPEDPVDPTNVYMVVQATVNPWVVSSEDITLD